METPVRPTAVNARASSPTPPTLPAGLAERRWLAHPALDLLGIANLWWVVACWPLWLFSSGESSLEFWQVYFLSTPHRWLTLFLVVTDTERRRGRGLRLGLWAVGLLAVIGVVQWQTSSLLCLLLVDYLWNAWHFGAQHGGVLRIYSRSVGPAGWRGEAWVMRGVVVYTSLRLVGWTTGWLAAWPRAEWGLRGVDGVVAGLAWLWWLTELRRTAWRRPAKIIYATSVLGIYTSLMVAVDLGQQAWVVSLVIASAAFHACEYLAIVSHYAQGRRSTGQRDVFARLANAWPLALVSFLTLMAAVGYYANLRLPEAWLAVNVWVALLHYAYDGLIWKLRDPATAVQLNLSHPAGDRPATVESASGAISASSMR